jgi:hypothetical protein
MAQANDDVARLIPRVFERFPPQAGEQAIRLKPNVHPLSDDVIGDVGRVLWILFGTVGIVLLMACANVANLFLVRAEGRRRAVRFPHDVVRRPIGPDPFAGLPARARAGGLGR